MRDLSSLRSRRSLLTGALGALAAITAQAVGRPLPVAAGGGSVVLGQNNVTDDLGYTGVERVDGYSRAALAPRNYGMFAIANGPGGIGVQGEANGSQSAIGVQGVTNGYNTQVAVDADGLGGNGEGYAVRARTKNGIAVYAEATGGAAIIANGVTEFSRSGRAALSAGQLTKTLRAGRITVDTLVVATIQGDVAGTWVRGVTVNVPGQSFTIRLNRAAPKALRVGWFVVN